MSNLRMFRGDTRILEATVVDSAGATVDISGADLRWTAKRKLGDLDADAVIIKTSVDGIDLVGGGTTGELTITLDPEDTDDLLKTTTLLWDLQVTDGIGQVTTVDNGRLRIESDVSRTTP